MDRSEQQGVALFIGSNRELGDLLNIHFAARSWSTACIIRGIHDSLDEDRVDDEIKQIEIEKGPIGIMVWGVMLASSSQFETLAPEEYAAYMDAVVHSAFLYTRACIRVMERRRSGYILFLSSVAATLGDDDVLTTLASGSINTFAKSLAREEGRRGITVNALSLGFIHDWEANQATVVRKFHERYFPFRKPLGLRELADVIVKITSGGTNHLNGQILRFDGGML